MTHSRSRFAGPSRPFLVAAQQQGFDFRFGQHAFCRGRKSEERGAILQFADSMGHGTTAAALGAVALGAFRAIRGRLVLAVSVLLLVGAVNVAAHYWGARRRAETFQELAVAIRRQSLLTEVRTRSSLEVTLPRDGGSPRRARNLLSRAFAGRPLAELGGR